jgi:peptidoglycan L-alanyl-D-glutamate endopeptidase CwlK
MFQLDDRSERKLVGIHPDLVRVVRKAAETYFDDTRQFIVTEGLRDVQRQVALIKAGASQTMNSRHLTGHAVDLAVKLRGQVRWDWPLYDELGRHLKVTARDMGIRLTWGGDWVTFRDGPHFELDKALYPVQSYTA